VLEACVLSDLMPHLTSSSLHSHAKLISDQEIGMILSDEMLETQRTEEQNLDTSESTKI